MPEDKTNVIVIEDDADINRLIAYNLRSEGFFVKQVYDGPAAMQALEGGNFGVIILDIMLPGIDGFDVCRQIRENEDYARSFVIVVSAKTNKQDKLYAHILGASYYLDKPFKVAELLSIVREFDSLNREKRVVRQE